MEVEDEFVEDPTDCDLAARHSGDAQSYSAQFWQQKRTAASTVN
jgi:hypothetical protein